MSRYFVEPCEKMRGVSIADYEEYAKLNRIAMEVCERWGIGVSELVQRTNKRKITEPLHVVVKLAGEFTGLEPKQIMEYFNRERTGYYQAVNSITGLEEVTPGMRKRMMEIRELFKKSSNV